MGRSLVKIVDYDALPKLHDPFLGWGRSSIPKTDQTPVAARANIVGACDVML